ncbi:MAG TPA: polysaccharide biosynthesis protein, partial [Anaerolineae bacterium]|nr:polysaccharide biosynthesis protein [Anaerolineae bacterium]
MLGKNQFIKNTTHRLGLTRGTGLRQLTMRGAFWTFFGFGLKQILRFASRTILSYLILPELFGIMTVVNVFILGLDFFSDIGIIPNIVQSKRGDDPQFLNTAWTVQIGRGILLWLTTLLIALPVANFYHNDIYRIVLPITGLAALIGGFKSTKLATAQRKLHMRDIIIIELIGYGSGLTVMLTWAYLQPSIWALVAHGLTQAVVEMSLSHLLLKGERNRFAWERKAVNEMFFFGRWIFLSTALTFLARESNKLIVARVMDERFVGI